MGLLTYHGAWCWSNINRFSFTGLCLSNFPNFKKVIVPSFNNEIERDVGMSCGDDDNGLVCAIIFCE